MKSHRWIPWFLLALLLLTAGAMAWGGMRQAQESTTVISRQGEDETTAFAGALLTEVTRLEGLLESHLLRLADSERRILGDPFEVRKRCGEIRGLRQIALVHPPASFVKDAPPFELDLATGRVPTSPTLDAETEPFPGRTSVPLTLSEEADHGWVDEPGKPLLFWRRRPSGAVIVVTPDVSTVGSIMQEWLTEWAKEPFNSIELTAATVRFEGPAGLFLNHGLVPDREADRFLPLRTRFGTWRLRSWDTHETVVTYHQPTLILGFTLAGLTSLLGIFGFFLLRRSFRMAEQRVSFVNRVSHELRTPLTNILLNSDLASNTENPLPPNVDRRLKVVREEARRLSRLIENVLTFSRREQNRLTLHPTCVDVQELISQSLEPFRPAFQRREIAVTRNIPANWHIHADPDAFEQIMANLYSNVEKYAAAGKHLHLEARNTGGSVEIVVTDRGPGIPPEAFEKVFSPFRRLETRVNEGSSGTGLGLAI
ncbi:MAG: HAMP domain-containing sensor histidine kinase, partial [Verrucomicrobiota bacterium]